MSHCVQGAGENIRQDEIDPDRMTYEVGLLNYISWTLKLFVSQLIFTSSQIINKLVPFRNCKNWENQLGARAKDFLQISSHGCQLSSTNQGLHQR